MRKDSLGDRMKDCESRFRYKLPRRAYTENHQDRCLVFSRAQRSIKR